MAAEDLRELCADLAAEHADLDGLVAPLDDAGWDTPTPAEGWSVRDQISHLAFFDEAGRTAITDPDAFTARLEEVFADPEGFMDKAVVRGRGMAPGEVLQWWRSERAALLDAAEALSPAARLPWYGPPMGGRSFLTARLMETWAHGQDVADALGAERVPTDRLRHVAHLGVRTRGFSYAVREREAPAADVRVELVGPGGDQWVWGDEAAPDRVVGPALDFCLVVTQRRNVADTALSIQGPLAEDWMGIAQAFAGGPGPGRPPASEARSA
jgi:uncharacterized protein (TIGR03084 family)